MVTKYVMRRVSAIAVFQCDYTDKEAVISLAKRFGKGQVVYKHPLRPNYNITHAARTDLFREEWVVYRTGD